MTLINMTENHIYYMLHKENNKRFNAVLHRTVKVGPSMWSITGTEVEGKAGSQPAVERYSQTLFPIDTCYNGIHTDAWGYQQGKACIDAYFFSGINFW